MADEPIKEERLERDLITKEVYHFIDSERQINQKCREVFKNKDKEVHYPIGYNGGPRYQHTKKFVYEGFKGNLPKGIQKSANRGLGFTKVLKSLMNYLENNFEIQEIRIVKIGTSVLDKNAKTLCLTESDLVNLYDVIKNLLDEHRNEAESMAAQQLNNLFPKDIKITKKQYIKNSIASALSFWEQSLSEFSDKDKDAVKDLFDKLSLTEGFFSAETLLKTKENLDEQYIDDVIKTFEFLMEQKSETKTLEKKWQAFLKKHSWIFSYIFSFPIIMLENEAYVGGKNLSNKDGKITDFIVKNDLTQNVAFIEIKTHRTELIKKGKAYRGTDVYAMSSDLSGAITQVLNQRDNFQKHFAIHKMTSEQQFESFNSKCVVLMGCLDDMDKNQIASFELFRSNSKDVEILTFDELLARFKNFKALMSGAAA